MTKLNSWQYFFFCFKSSPELPTECGKRFIHDLSITPDSLSCMQHSSTNDTMASRIRGGDLASPGAYPWQVSNAYLFILPNLLFLVLTSHVLNTYRAPHTYGSNKVNHFNNLFLKRIQKKKWLFSISVLAMTAVNGISQVCTHKLSTTCLGFIKN